MVGGGQRQQQLNSSIGMVQGVRARRKVDSGGRTGTTLDDGHHQSSPTGHNRQGGSFIGSCLPSIRRRDTRVVQASSTRAVQASSNTSEDAIHHEDNNEAVQAAKKTIEQVDG